MFGTTKQATHAQVAWASALTRFKLADALYRSNNAFGKSKNLGNLYELEKASGEQVCGSALAAKAHPVHGPRIAAALAAVDMADDRAFREIIRPADEAALALVHTPAPDADALLFKVGVIQRYELDNYDGFPGDPIDHIAAEAARLAGEVA